MTINRRAFIQKSAAASFAGALSLPAFAAEQTLKYGGSPWLGHYPAHLAMAEGYLKEVGISQDWQSFATSSARMSAFMSGGVDIGCAGIVSALALMSRGAKQFAIIAIPENFGRVEGLVARKGIDSIADLKGKKIGVTFASSTHLLVLDVLQQAGIKPGEADVLNIPGPELHGAIKTGQIDAAAAWTPHFDNILREPGVKLLADDSQFSLYKTFKVTPGPDVLLVRREFAAKNRDLVKAYLSAYFKASDLLREQPEKASQALLKFTGLTMKEQMSAVTGSDWYPQAQQKELLTGEFVQGLQKLAEMLVQHKQIDKAPVVKDWIDASFV